MIDFDALQGIFDAASIDDLRKINNAAVDTLNFKQRLRSATAMSKLSVGQKVSFAGRGGRTVTGVIEKLNRTTAIVAVGLPYGTPPRQDRWRVSAGTLTPVV